MIGTIISAVLAVGVLGCAIVIGLAVRTENRRIRLQRVRTADGLYLTGDSGPVYPDAEDRAPTVNGYFCEGTASGHGVFTDNHGITWGRAVICDGLEMLMAGGRKAIDLRSEQIWHDEAAFIVYPTWKLMSAMGRVAR